MNYTRHSFSRRAQRPMDGSGQGRSPWKAFGGGPSGPGTQLLPWAAPFQPPLPRPPSPRGLTCAHSFSPLACALHEAGPGPGVRLTGRVRGGSRAADLWAVPGPPSDSARGTWGHPGPHLTFHPASGSGAGGDGRGADAGLQASLPSAHNAARSVAGSPGAGEAPAPSAAPQPGLSRWRLSALRQLRKEAPGPTGRRPPLQALT